MRAGVANSLPIKRPKPRVELTGSSRAILALQQDIERVARSDAKVLITGETGVGKEIVANTIHARGLRAPYVFAPVNCAGLPDTLLESELFGHVRGSFTGAYRDKCGTFESADKGTLFLDEVGEMTARMQGLVLRALETGETEKVGGDVCGYVNVRVIAATNRDLRGLTQQGLFREDLFFRLSVVHLVVPPLRERRDDIPPLVHQFLSQFASSTHSSAVTIASDAMQALVEYPWPGNVRELQHPLERLVVTLPDSTITVNHLPSEILGRETLSQRPTCERRRTIADDLYQRMLVNKESFWTTVHPPFTSRDITRENVREVIRRGLHAARGNYTSVARLFNIDRRDYKRFLNFLRKHDCQLPFKEYR
jgi:transcriptional regulator with GAF, ATPase, and Fis domain